MGYMKEYRNDKGLLHRIDGPAVIFVDGSKGWYKNGHLHRLNGPAIIYACGTKFWYIKGKEFTEQEFNDKIFGSRLIPKEMWDI